jgi:3-phytase
MRPWAVVVLVFLALFAIAGCSLSSGEETGGSDAASTREPAASTEAGPPTAPALDSSRIAESATPFAETPDLVVGKGDDADDVAIHPDGYVIGVSKNSRGGLEVYDLEGKRLQWVQLGETNNVDLTGSTVVSSNRSEDRVDIFAFRDGRLEYERSFPVPFDPYGVCLYRDTVVVTATEGSRVEQYSLAGRHLRSFRDIASQAEGCVSDEKRGLLYVAEEERGIWRFEAGPGASSKGTLIDEVGDHLHEDIEGLTLASPFLIASSQGDSTYAVYRNDEYLASFRITDSDEIDGTNATDGIAANPAVDLFVAHDSENTGGESSNYKYVRLSEIFGS